MDITEEIKESAARAFELLENKDPHQLAVELVTLQNKHAAAMIALGRMQGQRDQATRQCEVMAGLLREIRAPFHPDPLNNDGVILDGANGKDILLWMRQVDNLMARNTMARKLPELANQLTTDETAFLDWTCKYPGCKNENMAWGNEIGGDRSPLWPKLEQLGLIKVVGSYKWVATEKGRAELSAALPASL